eukprot:12306631-Alexandrium_andersonii.AAC.1
MQPIWPHADQVSASSLCSSGCVSGSANPAYDAAGHGPAKKNSDFLPLTVAAMLSFTPGVYEHAAHACLSARYRVVASGPGHHHNIQNPHRPQQSPKGLAKPN